MNKNTQSYEPLIAKINNLYNMNSKSMLDLTLIFKFNSMPPKNDAKLVFDSITI